MARKSSRRDPEPSRSVSPSRPSPSRPSTPSPSRPSADQTRAHYEAKAASERAQRDIYSAQVARDARESLQGILTRVPKKIAKPVVDKAVEQAKLDAAKRLARSKNLKRAITNKSRQHLEGALTSKPVRAAERSVEKLRALKCKSRPKSKKSRRGSGGSKRFVPWC